MTRVRILRWVLAACFLYAGLVHILHPGFILPIMPAWVPAPRLTVVATGWCELAGALGLLLPATQRAAGVMLALYAVCVYPANITHAAIDLGQGTGLGWWYHLPRLAFQPVIVWWCLVAGGVAGRRHSDREA